MALLPDRKLVSFEDQPLAAVPSGKEGMRRLLYYYFEDQLKKRYAFLVLLSQCLVSGSMLHFQDLATILCACLLLTPIVAPACWSLLSHASLTEPDSCMQACCVILSTSSAVSTCHPYSGIMRLAFIVQHLVRDKAALNKRLLRLAGMRRTWGCWRRPAGTTWSS